MSAPTVFFDIGGVLLTNAWDTPARRRAAETFGLDYPEFQTRHEMLKTAFETGRLSIDTYIRKTVFHRERKFTPEVFKDFMFHQSQLIGETSNGPARSPARGTAGSSRSTTSRKNFTNTACACFSSIPSSARS